ncbi:hypothetical protein AB9Q10_26515 [Streptomyces krungchingensis]|uniref:hypothetical protein n=1 Tax=Streptomyces krungchingensis TaxID=1565034 RepID=UPI003CF822B2
MTNVAGFSSRTALVLPLPTELPSAVGCVGDRLARRQDDLGARYALAMGADSSAAAARTELLAWTDIHAERGRPVEAEPPAGSCVHDRFFAVERAHGDSAGLLADALLVSDLLVRADLARNGSTLDEDPDNLLLGVTPYLTRTLPPATKHVVWQPADPDAAAQERWLVGHQRFFVMLQLLITGLQELGQVAETPREQEAVRGFGWLCRSTAVSMRYAADFPPELYGPVRDTMTPPTVNAGFSGLQTRDHHALVSCMRQSKRDGVFDRLAPASVAAVHAAMQHLYDAHIWVCDRFGGSHEPSLLMAQTGQASGAVPPESGVEAAGRLARQRLGYLSPAGRD